MAHRRALIFKPRDQKRQRQQSVEGYSEIAAALIEEGRVEGRDFWQVHDRAEAIAFAISLAKPGDIVITCGKAHESSMCYGTDETPWDEFAAVRAGLAKRGAA